MARVEIPIVDVPFQGSLADATAGGVAGDATNDHHMRNDGKTQIHIENGSVGVVNVTIISVPDNLGRTQDDSKAIPAGKTGVFGPYKTAAWNQVGGLSDGRVQVDLDVDTTVIVAGVRPAATP